MPAQRKIDIVAKLKDKVSRAKSMVFTNYQGLTHKQLEDLKRALKTLNAELVVTKNTLLKLALETSNLKPKTLNLEGPTATLFSFDDSLAPLKELAKTIKLLKPPASPARLDSAERAGGPVIKFGILEGRVLSGEEVLRLAILPAREILLAQLIGQVRSPIFGLDRALSWNIQKLELTLKAIETKKATSH